MVHLAALAVVAVEVTVAQAYSATCAGLSGDDVLLLVGFQNCFLDSRPLRPKVTAAYDLGNRSSLEAGRLWVDDSAPIVDVANDWLRLASTSDATVVVALDWHPPRHCSFCYVGESTEAIAVGTACISGSLSEGLGLTSERCADATSRHAYELQQYFQWPSHCEAGSFDARLDPYLSLIHI